jgi:hypothetical protein
MPKTTDSSIEERFIQGGVKTQRLPSSAAASVPSDHVNQLLLPDEMRAKMPLTKDKYLVKENEHLVAWERETRKFLRRLSPNHGHRVSAVMIYEWATGKNVQTMINEGTDNPKPDLMKINKCLKFYFGKSYSTWIAGRKVPNCYRVKPGVLIKYRRPMTLTLYAEWQDKTLIA